jgi:hypothetical protein
MHRSSADTCDRIQRAMRDARTCGAREERRAMLLDLVERTLLEFHGDWSALCREKNGDEWLTAADECCDRYAHQLYDMAREVQDVLTEDLTYLLRTFSADMIKTTNICHMLWCEDEFRERGSDLARQARRSADLFIVRRRVVRRKLVPAR